MALERRNYDAVFERVIRDSEAINYIKETIEGIKKDMSEICKVAKSEDGFVRCRAKEKRIASLERYKWYLIIFFSGVLLTNFLDKILK